MSNIKCCCSNNFKLGIFVNLIYNVTEYQGFKMMLSNI